MAEIIIPGVNKPLNPRDLLLPGEPERSHWPTLYVPVDEQRQRQELDFFDAAVQELGIDSLTRQINPITGEYEFLAPEGHEFVIRGSMNLWRRGPGVYSPPEPSEQLWAEQGEDEDTIPFGDEFRGRRLSVDVWSNNFNPREHKERADNVNIFENRDERKPWVNVTIKGDLEAVLVAVEGEVLPFDIEDRPNEIVIPENVTSYEWSEASGRTENITIEVVPLPPRQNQALQVGIDHTLWSDRKDELWVPIRERRTMEESFRRDPAMKDYMMARLGGTEEDLYAYYRRLGNPYADDPLWKAKDLEVVFYFDGDLGIFVSREIERMPEGNRHRRAAEALVSLIGSEV